MSDRRLIHEREAASNGKKPASALHDFPYWLIPLALALIIAAFFPPSPDPAFPYDQLPPIM